MASRIISSATFHGWPDGAIRVAARAPWAAAAFAQATPAVPVAVTTRKTITPKTVITR